MFEEIIFDQIQKKTYQIMLPFRPTVNLNMETAILVFHGWDSQACYLLMRNGERAVFYGIKSSYYDMSPTAEAVVEKSEGGSFCDLFAHRVELDEFEMETFVNGFEESMLKKYAKKLKKEEETLEDFLTRNAIWLLNPLVH